MAYTSSASVFAHQDNADWLKRPAEKPFRSAWRDPRLAPADLYSGDAQK
jgi:hypothetical protein